MYGRWGDTMHSKNVRISIFFYLIFLNHFVIANSKKIEEFSKKLEQTIQENNYKKLEGNSFVIKSIIIHGNKKTSTSIIKKSIPYIVGFTFDSNKSGDVIRNLYDLGYFSQINIEVEILNDKELVVIIDVEEKKTVNLISIEGNKALSKSKLDEKFHINKISNIDEETLRKLSIGIKKLYREEGYHFTNIATSMIPDTTDKNKVSAVISIEEGQKSAIKRVFFKGNNNIPERKLKKGIFTRENWLLSFTDGAGAYNEEAIEMDKHRIEYFYRDNGYLTIKILDADVKFSDDKKDVYVTFHLNEGQKFIIRKIEVQGDEYFSDEDMFKVISLEEDQIYSQTKLVQSISKLKDLWGEKGYIYADVYPNVKPSEKGSEVDISFIVEKGKRFYTNRIGITGNNVTRDTVIRRQLSLVEGELITTKKLQQSKSAVEYLGFFERDGIDWKIHRLSDNLADVEVHVHEAKTGSLSINLSYGDERSSKNSLKGQIVLDKKNIFGLGWDAGLLFEANRHEKRSLEAHFSDPNIFDSNVSAAFNVYRRYDEYDQWKTTIEIPKQVVIGCQARFGFNLPSVDKFLTFFLGIGIESIENNKPIIESEEERELFDALVKDRFEEGTMKWLNLDIVKDTRNHQVYPNKGYKFMLSNKIVPLIINKEYSFLKTEIHASSYTSIIGVDSLVFATQVKLSHITPTSEKKIPYKELFHMGGQSTVRGFTWGGIGPARASTGEPLGAKDAILFNTELIFPLLDDYSMKGHFFYDTGAGWNTPNKERIPTKEIMRNNFEFRHSVGFGLNLLKPVPAKIDWGFKLDRKKDKGESSSEFHLSMNYAW
jgi:outer membrane protein insertion porin family